MQAIESTLRTAEASPAGDSSASHASGPRRAKLFGILAAFLLCHAGSAHADAGAHLRGIAEAYFDLFEQYPTAYSCEVRSAELVASLEPQARQAWGQGHIRLRQTPQGLRLAAEDLADPKAAPFFNIALGLWQFKLGAELQILQGRLPEFFIATALGALLKYQGYETLEDDLLRFGLRARSDHEAIQDISFLVEDGYAIRELQVRNRDGSSLLAKVRNIPAPGDSKRWLVSEIEAALTKSDGKKEVWSASLGYRQVADRLLFEHILLRLTDDRGNPIKHRPKDVNPISYYFSGCQLLD